MILRIEDHDQIRSQSKYEEALLKDLDWLGLIPDDGVSSVEKPSQYRQSDQLTSYQSALDLLRAQQIAYGCSCSRQAIKSRQSGSPDKRELFYDNFCRKKETGPIEQNRVRLTVPDKTYCFHDRLAGAQAQNPAQQCGDFLLRDNDGQMTYHFACSIDDLNQNINLIIRGIDLIESTGRQMYLMDILKPNRPKIDYYHHNLIYDDLGKKLSKRVQSDPIHLARQQGLPPSYVIGEAFKQLGASEIGANPDPAAISDYFHNLLSRTDDDRHTT